jgi:hypothetical protein
MKQQGKGSGFNLLMTRNITIGVTNTITMVGPDDGDGQRKHYDTLQAGEQTSSSNYTTTTVKEVVRASISVKWPPY